MFIGNYYKRSKNHSLFTTLILNLTNTTSKSCLNQLEGNGCEMADSYIPMPEYSDCEATQVRSRCKDVLSKKTLRIHVFTKKYIAVPYIIKTLTYSLKYISALKLFDTKHHNASSNLAMYVFKKDLCISSKHWLWTALRFSEDGYRTRTYQLNTTESTDTQSGYNAQLVQFQLRQFVIHSVEKDERHNITNNSGKPYI